MRSLALNRRANTVGVCRATRALHKRRICPNLSSFRMASPNPNHDSIPRAPRADECPQTGRLDSEDLQFQAIRELPQHHSLYPQRTAHPANDQCPSPRVSNGAMLKLDCQIHLRDSMDVNSTRGQPSVVLWRRCEIFGRPAQKQTLTVPIRVVSFSVPIRGLPAVANNSERQTREEGRTATPHVSFSARFP